MNWKFFHGEVAKTLGIPARHNVKVIASKKYIPRPAVLEHVRNKQVYILEKKLGNGKFLAYPRKTFKMRHLIFSQKQIDERKIIITLP